MDMPRRVAVAVIVMPGRGIFAVENPSLFPRFTWIFPKQQGFDGNRHR